MRGGRRTTRPRRLRRPTERRPATPATPRSAMPACSSRSTVSSPTESARTISSPIATNTASLSYRLREARIPDAQQVDTGGQRPYSTGSATDAVGDGVHVEGIADHDAVEAELVTQHRHPRCAHRRRRRVDGWDRDMGGEHATSPGVDRRGERRDVAVQERVAISVNHRQRQRASRCGSRHGPGSVWHMLRRPATAPRARRLRRDGQRARSQAPNERTPMTGLSGSELTSTTGARTTSMPARRAVAAMLAATARLPPNRRPRRGRHCPATTNRAPPPAE